MQIGCGEGIRTPDLRVMSPTSCRCSTPRPRILTARPRCDNDLDDARRHPNVCAGHGPPGTTRIAAASARFRGQRSPGEHSPGAGGGRVRPGTRTGRITRPGHARRPRRAREIRRISADLGGRGCRPWPVTRAVLRGWSQARICRGSTGTGMHPRRPCVNARTRPSSTARPSGPEGSSVQEDPAEPEGPDASSEARSRRRRSPAPTRQG
ncbi:MAG: hypothetical protein HW391_659 [Chloroflexi bacterium]|nr:hypothetical protein [Chloroflexota bacterium]